MTEQTDYVWYSREKDVLRENIFRINEIKKNQNFVRERIVLDIIR